jgi:thiol:disulfide interchange protein DsbD
VNQRPSIPTRRLLRLTPGLRTLAATLVALAVFLWPLVASADGAECAASDTGAFQRYLAQGSVVAIGASYVFGLATSLTPCVYPMIAITVSVFGAKEAKSRWQGMALSLTFVLGIVCLFTPMGVISAMSGKGFGAALGNWWVVGGIALVFLALAASLFGAFELALPSGLNNRLSTVGGAGYRGAFLLGLVCGLVAAPCVGPFLFGLLGWIATTHNVALGSAAMAFYGLGLGTLFFVVGTFAVSLPKAGAWMMGVKWIGGVCLAYMAFAYIRDALPPETKHKLASSGLGYGVFAMAVLVTGLVLGGIHVAAERRKSPIAKWSKSAKLASIVPAIAGLFMAITWYQLPPELHWETNEAAALAKANGEHKPVLIDFGASWCGACKELDEKTFPDPKVQKEGARFVALHIDATDDDDPAVATVRKKYGATEGLPVVVLLDGTGKEAKRFTEFVPPDCFASALATVQ